MGAELALRVAQDDRLHVPRLVPMSNRMHRGEEFAGGEWPGALPAGRRRPPGWTVCSPVWPQVVFRPSLGPRLTVQGNPEARDLVRHAFADVPGNGNRARSWARFARRWPTGPRSELLDLYPQLSLPVLLLWAEQDRAHPLLAAQEALELLPDAQLRTLPGTGFLMAYDDPVSLGSELIAFCR